MPFGIKYFNFFMNGSDNSTYRFTMNVFGVNMLFTLKFEIN